MSDEEWRPVVGWEGLYEVSSHGRVRSLDREVSDRSRGVSRRRGKILTPTPSTQGYLILSLCRGGVRFSARTHRLVCEAFQGPPPFKGALVLHHDDNPKNNNASNLRWGCQKENMRDLRRNNPRTPKTHCPQGHEYTPKNTYKPPAGGRVCRTCKTARRDR